MPFSCQYPSLWWNGYFFIKARFGIFTRPKALITLLGVFFASLVTGFLTFYFFNGRVFDFLLNGYDVRSFTMLERTLTQPRILLEYLSIFLPLPERLSIVHDVTLSYSLLLPWTTLPSIILIFGAIAGAVFYARRYPLLCFAVLFYFLNHVVESTILPLELVFEHRNYLPSAFLFLPFAAGFYHVLTRLQQFNKTGQAAWIGLMTCVIVGLGVFTYERNKAWATPELLWRDAVVKAPQNSRPYIFLGVELAWREHASPANLRHALVLFNHSLGLDMHQKLDRAKTLGNMAWVYFFQGKDEKAVETFQQAITEFPDFFKNRMDMISPLMRLGRFDEAERQAEYLVSKFPGNPKYWNALGLVLLWQEDYESALACFQTAMHFEPKINGNLLFHLGVSLTRAGHLERGNWFLSQAIQHIGVLPMKQLARIENRVRAEELKTAGRVAGQLADAMPVSTIIALLKSLPQHLSVPIDVDLIRPVIYDSVAGMLTEETDLQESPELWPITSKGFDQVR